MNFKLRGKIIGLAVLAALIPTVVLTTMVMVKERSFTAGVTTKLHGITDERISGSARNVYEFCNVANALVQDKLKSGIDLAQVIAKSEGGIKFDGPPVTWQAINQLTKDVNEVTLPGLQLGTKPVVPNPDISVPMPVVDEVTRLTSSSCTIFQRMDESGSMLRVATTVRNADGKRAIGTYIPASDPDGQTNPVLSLTLAGIPFRGAAFVVDKWLITLYDPIKDEYGETSGMLYLGMPMNEVPGLQGALNAQALGEGGVVRIFRGPGPGQGEVVLQSNTDEIGNNMWNSTDAEGVAYVRQIIEKAREMPYGTVGTIRAQLTRSGQGEPEDVIIKFIWFQPWNWVIAAYGYVSDFSKTEDEVTSALRDLRWATIITGGVALLLALVFSWILARRIARPIGDLTVVADHVATGNLNDADRQIVRALRRQEKAQQAPTAYLRAETQDETNILTQTFGRMIRQLNSLVSKVKGSSLQLVTTAAEITATARQQERNVQDFGISSNEIAAAVKEISATSQELLSTMDDVTGVASNTAEMADDGRKSLGEMENAMRRLAKATRSISSKLSVINEKANNIGVVISTISDVADQTNLLSLNAAIEAEKAGSAGQGFAVVAREIRRLADQTAVSTLDIEDLVKEMQSSVSSGVMEMDKFTDEVRRGVDETAAISKQFASIIEQVQALTPRFEMVHEGMQSQHAGANQINEAMLKLTESAKLSSESLREFNEAAEQLREALTGLKDEVSQFKCIQNEDGTPGCASIEPLPVEPAKKGWKK